MSGAGGPTGAGGSGSGGGGGGGGGSGAFRSLSAAFAAATQRFHVRLVQARDPLSRGRILLEWADASLGAGRSDEAVPLLEKGLEEIAEPVPRRTLGARLFSGRPTPPEPAPVPPSGPEAERLALSVDLLDRLAAAVEGAADPARTRLARRRALANAARLGPGPRLARALGREVVDLAEAGEPDAAESFLRALEAASARLAGSGDAAGAAAARTAQAQALLHLGRLAEAERAATIARESAEAAGAASAPAHRAAIAIGALAAVLSGRPREAQHLAETARRAAAAADRTDEVVEADLVAGLAEALTGPSEEAVRRIAAAREGLSPARDPGLAARAALAAAEVALLAGDWTSARALAAEARRSRPAAPTLARALPPLIEADACLAGIRGDGGARPTIARAGSLLEAAATLVEDALRVVDRIPALGPRAGRIAAEIAVERGQGEAALASLERLVPQAHDLAGPVEAARCRIALATLAIRAGSDRDPRALLAEAEQIAGAVGAETVRRQAEALARRHEEPVGAASVQEVRRELSSLLDVGRAVSSILELDPLLERILDAIVETLHAERGFLMLYDEPRPLEGEPGRGKLSIRVARNVDRERIDDPEFQVSRSVAAEVERTRQPTVVSDALRDPRFQEQSSVLKLRLHSLLCFPLKTTRTFYGVVYVDNRSIARLFGMRHLELMLPFAAQAAVAIENAYAFAHIRELYKETQSIAAAREKILNHVSHELKTPISIIRGGLNVLGRKLASDAEAARTIARAERNLQRLVDIQQAMQDIYRARERDSLPPEPPERLALGPLLADLVAEARAAVPERALDIAISGADDLSVQAPRRPLEIAVRGLLRNAVENTPDEGRIEIVARPDVPDVVELTVRDFGIGITAENQRHIFQGFFHTQPTESYSSGRPYQFAAGGKGLELVRIKAFADRHAWELGFSSERCRFIPREQDACPGRISRCPHCPTRETCLGSGRTEFRLVLPAG